MTSVILTNLSLFRSSASIKPSIFRQTLPTKVDSCLIDDDKFSVMILTLVVKSLTAVTKVSTLRSIELKLLLIAIVLVTIADTARAISRLI